MEDYSKAIEEGWVTYRYYHARGELYYYLGEYEKAIEDYSKAIENYSIETDLFPLRIDYYIDRGDAYYCLKEYEKAIKDYSCALEFESTCEEVEDLEKIISGHLDSDFKKHRKQEQLDNF